MCEHMAIWCFLPGKAILPEVFSFNSEISPHESDDEESEEQNEKTSMSSHSIESSYEALFRECKYREVTKSKCSHTEKMQRPDRFPKVLGGRSRTEKLQRIDPSATEVGGGQVNVMVGICHLYMI